MTAPYVSRIQFLVVEDNEFCRAIVRDVLKALGARFIRYADNGAEALEVLRETPIDIVLLDWAMPVMDGLEFTDKVRRSDESPNPFLPIIMMTAYSERTHVLKARDAGVTEYIIKPFSAKQLLKRIEVVIENPRPFVRSETYFGPDRRRHRKKSKYTGPERRKQKGKQVPPDQMPQPGEDYTDRTNIGQDEANEYFTPENGKNGAPQPEGGR